MSMGDVQSFEYKCQSRHFAVALLEEATYILTVVATKSLKRVKRGARSRNSRSALSGSLKEDQRLTRYVDISPVQEFVKKRMPGSPLDEALSRQPSKVSVTLFLELLPLYLQLGELKKGK